MGGDSDQPAGGWEDCPVPKGVEPGFTVKFTFHRATNLPIADYATRSSDPYIYARLSTSIPSRHPDVPPFLVFRTPTVQRNVEPEWNCEWVVANVPASGFKLKCRLMDEDPAGHDDRLGNAHVDVDQLSENFEPIREGKYEVEKRSGSWRAYGLRMVANAVDHNKSMTGSVYVSVEVLGRTQGEGGKLYTCGPGHWSQHFSPLIGKWTGTKAEADGSGPQETSGDKQVVKYDFTATELQLAGPVPDELFHRFVEFKSFVKGMFDKTGVRGHILNKLLHKQHDKIYSFDKNTKYGTIPEPGEELARRFLEFVNWDEGSRLYTYVLMLDGQLRFTETGKSFGIDLLSKHTMHSDVSQYIACSGEFFVRRNQSSASQENAPTPEDHTAQSDQKPDGGSAKSSPPKDPRMYELIIDNDSGTYRPKGELLPKLGEFLDYNFKGLKVTTMTCDDDHLQKMKEHQRKVRAESGNNTIYTQISDSDSSLSSSDEDEINGKGNKRERNELSKKERFKQAITEPQAAVMGWASKQA